MSLMYAASARMLPCQCTACDEYPQTPRSSFTSSQGLAFAPSTLTPVVVPSTRLSHRRVLCHVMRPAALRILLFAPFRIRRSLQPTAAGQLIAFFGLLPCLGVSDFLYGAYRPWAVGTARYNLLTPIVDYFIRHSGTQYLFPDSHQFIPIPTPISVFASDGHFYWVFSGLPGA